MTVLFQQYVVGFSTVGTADMKNVQDKCYWRPWQSDSTETGRVFICEVSRLFYDSIVSAAFHDTILITKQYVLQCFQQIVFFLGRMQKCLKQHLYHMTQKLSIETKTNVIILRGRTAGSPLQGDPSMYSMVRETLILWTWRVKLHQQSNTTTL